MRLSLAALTLLSFLLLSCTPVAAEGASADASEPAAGSAPASSGNATAAQTETSSSSSPAASTSPAINMLSPAPIPDSLPPQLANKVMLVSGVDVLVNFLNPLNLCTLAEIYPGQTGTVPMVVVDPDNCLGDLVTFVGGSP